MKSLWIVFRFCLICSALFALVISLPERCFLPLNLLTARLACLLLELFQAVPQVAGTRVSLGGFSAVIITECSGLYPSLLLISYLLAFPAAFRLKALGIVTGVALLNLANAVRIAGVIAIGARHPKLFEYVHIYLGQVLMILLVTGISIAWQRKATGSEDRTVAFLMRAAVAASLVFAPWVIINRCYVETLDRLVMGGFFLAGYRLHFLYAHHDYYQTFNLVPFIALMLAERRLSHLRRISWTLAGTAIVVSGHLLFRVGNVLLCAFSWEPAFKLTVALTLTGEYLLPVLIWLAATSHLRENSALRPGYWYGGGSICR